MPVHALTRMASRISFALAMPVWIQRRGVPRTPFGTPALQRRAEAMLEALDFKHAELSILLCDDTTIHELNREHRAKDRPTDVLAFPMQDPAHIEDRGLLGDVVISLPTAQRQATKARRPTWDEITMLLAHGLLHLVGYDHKNDRDEREMNEQTELLCDVTRPGG